jgi:phospholipid/cholesterol/gamma-HCH transport system permease protein
MTAAPSIDRSSRTATIAVDGDLAIPNAKAFYDCVRAVARRRDVRRVVLDFKNAQRIDGAGLAVISLGRKLTARSGKKFDLANVDAKHAKALELSAVPPAANDEVEKPLTRFERLGTKILELGESAVASVKLFGDAFNQLGQVIMGKKKLPKGATSGFIITMGIDALPIVCMLSALLGATLAFQGVVLLKRFGAGIYVADMTGLAMVREFAPMMTAIVLTGRNGAAIAAELGTMRVRGELDALDAMGISSSRFLLLPRLLALSFVEPALTLIGVFVGILGSLLVATATLDIPAWVFWGRVVERVDMMDFIHGLTKSFVFAQIIGFTGSYLGMRATNDPSSVGAATTRTVVVGIFLIILVDAIAATLGSLGGSS